MRNVKRNRIKKGFTLIELSISIVFISILSITIAMIINDAVSAYRRGLNLNKINSTGMSIVDDMRTAIQNSYTRSAVQECMFAYSESAAKEQCENDGGYKYVFMTGYADVVGVQTITREEGKVPVYGAFCTGNYSYIWNSGYYFATQNYSVAGLPKATLKGTWPDENGQPIEGYKTDFKLLKVKDDYRKVCRSVLMDNAYQLKEDSWDIDISGYGAIDEAPVDMLGESSDNNLALYNLYVAKPARSNSLDNFLYSASFVLGTLQGGINIGVQGTGQYGDYCATPDGYTSYENFDYCSINKFNFAAQAIGG